MKEGYSMPMPITEEAFYIDDGKPLKPLSDPVIAFIFRSAEAGGDAMRGLANAILEDSGDKPISRVISLIPQRYQTSPGGRILRLDVLAESEANEIVLLEVQLDRQSIFATRSMVYAMESLQKNIDIGDSWDAIALKMPRVISINLLDFELREKGVNFHQIIEPIYREPPHEVAEHHHVTHNIELPKFRKATPDWGRPLHLWLTAICRAQDQNITLREVVDMDPVLQAFESADSSFSQFVNNYGVANMDPETRREYRRGALALMFHRMELNAEREEGKAEGKAEGIAEGKAEGIAEGKAVGKAEGIKAIAKNLLNLSIPIDQIVAATGISQAELEMLSE